MVLATVAYLLSQSALEDAVRATGIASLEAERALVPGLFMLSRSIAIVGTLLVAFAAATAFLLARQLTTPLQHLAQKVGALRPGQWQTQYTVHTNDEVETLDVALVDMAERLASVYTHQEEEIFARTAELRQQYEMDRAILESIHLGVLTVDLQGVITQANPAAQSLLRYQALMGQRIDDVFPLRGHRGIALPGTHVVHQCLAKNSVFRTPPSAHWSVERSDKSLLPITLSVVPLKDEQQTFGALVMFQNVTEERHLDYLKSEFITLASHQLRTPLSAIRWYAELLDDARDTLNEEQRGYVDEIDHSVRRMIALLGALLHAARMEDEVVRPAMTPVNLVALVEETVRDSAEVLREAGMHQKVILPSSAVTVRTDPVLLRVVLQNLLSNAVKYSPKNSTIAVCLETDDAHATIRVTDEGLGIPMSEQERIFEKFFRASNVKQMDTDGNGLGLSISKSIVDRLGGSLRFESAENKGTTFFVTLPLLSSSSTTEGAKSSA